MRREALPERRRRRFKPIYKPSGRAAEYGEYAINIYTGCDNGCWYCYAPKVLHMSKMQFQNVQPRFGIIPALWEQLSSFRERGITVVLCFTCDPYPRNIDSLPTREVIKAIKQSGNHVQILTKNPITRDFDLLDNNDWYGVTLTGNNTTAARDEPGAASVTERMKALYAAKASGINTWISLEPVLRPDFAYSAVQVLKADLFRIGKLNYYPSDINWKQFGDNIENLCQQCGTNYYIKEELRNEMQ